MGSRWTDALRSYLDDTLSLPEWADRAKIERGQQLFEEWVDDMTPGRLIDAFNPALIRHLIGDETADMLNVRKSRVVDDLGRLARIANWFFVHVLRRTERSLPGYRKISRAVVPFGHDLLEALFTVQRGGERAPFAIPAHLAARWELAVPHSDTR